MRSLSLQVWHGVSGTTVPSEQEVKGKTNHHGRFLAYLAEKKVRDEWTSRFCLEKKWRDWKFRLYYNRKKNEDLFLNIMEEKYGKDCVLHHGDWSRKDQMNGCPPSLGVGLRKVLQKKFDVTEVDEFNTSKTWNICFGEMSGHVKRDGRRSYSKLCCWNCAGHCKKQIPERGSEHTTNRDVQIKIIGVCKVPQEKGKWRGVRLPREDQTLCRYWENVEWSCPVDV